MMCVLLSFFTVSNLVLYFTVNDCYMFYICLHLCPWMCVCLCVLCMNECVCVCVCVCVCAGHCRPVTLSSLKLGMNKQKIAVIMWPRMSRVQISRLKMRVQIRASYLPSPRALPPSIRLARDTITEYLAAEYTCVWMHVSSAAAPITRTTRCA